MFVSLLRLLLRKSFQRNWHCFRDFPDFISFIFRILLDYRSARVFPALNFLPRVSIDGMDEKKKRKEKENFFPKQELRDELWKQRNRADNKEIFILQTFPTNTTVFNFAFISFLLFLPQTKERQKISIEIANCSHRNQFVSVTVLPAWYNLQATISQFIAIVRWEIIPPEVYNCHELCNSLLSFSC